MTGFIIAAMVIGLCRCIGEHIKQPTTKPQYPNLISYLLFYDVNNE